MAIFNSYVSLPSVIPSHLGWLRTDFPALGFWYFPNDITVSCLSPVKNLKQPRHSRLQNLTTTSHISQYISQFYPSLSSSFIVISHYISLNQILHHHVMGQNYFRNPNQLMVNTKPKNHKICGPRGPRTNPLTHHGHVFPWQVFPWRMVPHGS